MNLQKQPEQVAMKIRMILAQVASFVPLVAALALCMPVEAAEPMPLFTKDAVILFQGDSITAGGRGGDPNHAMGHGYAFIIAAKFGSQLADRSLSFLNRGVSSNTVGDLSARWQGDAINLKPDVLSILVGINDDYRKVDPREFEKQYDQLLAKTVQALPDVKLVICEPFRLPLTDSVRPFQEITARLAEKYRAPLVRLQHVFEEAEKRTDPRGDGKYWIWDHVHPTYSGHQLIADEWIRTVEAFYGPGTTTPRR